MSLADVHARFGAPALLRLVALLLTYLALAALRTPLQLAVGLLTALMSAADRAASTRLATPTPAARPRAAWSKGRTA